jgi:hypothetical protein
MKEERSRGAGVRECQAVALAFGATQALAAPAAPEPTAALACTDEYCRDVVCYPFPGICQRGKYLCAG